MADYPDTLRLLACDYSDVYGCVPYIDTPTDDGTHYTRTATLPRWRPASEPVPQDEPGRMVFVLYLTDAPAREGDSGEVMTADTAAEVLECVSDACRWLWWDELDAMLSRGGEG